MLHLWLVAGTALAVLTFPGTLELFVLTIAGLLPAKRTIRRPGAAIYRIAVVVPAHDEEVHVARCVSSLLAASHAGLDRSVTVVADNCDDDTALAASRAGARVLVRRDEQYRGKGYALDFGFRTLADENWDAFAVVDADSEVTANFLLETVAMLESGAQATQCRLLVRNADDSLRTRLMSVALGAFNVLRARGRDRCGLSAGIYGNGFALSARTVKDVPYNAASIVEDLEYHLALIEAGKRVRFVDGAVVYGDIPTAVAGATTQRTRWEGGRFRMIRQKAPELVGQILRGKLLLLEPCLDLVLLPLAFHVTLLAIAAATPLQPVRAVALFGLGTVLIHLLAGIYVSGSGLKAVAALLAAPLYIGWKLMLVPKLLRGSRSGTNWIRTAREPKGPVQ